MVEKGKIVFADETLCKSGDIIVRNIDGEAVLLDLNTGIYYSLDPVGARIWELMDENGSASEIAEQIAREYDVTLETALEDIGELLGDLLGEGLIKKETATID